jgi:DNA processing protein
MRKVSMAHLHGDLLPRRSLTMSALSDLGRDDRTARITLSIVALSNDPSTGQLLRRVGAAEVLRLVDSDSTIPGMDRVEAGVWRDRIHSKGSPDQVSAQVAQLEASSFMVLVPGDSDWPTAVDDLGDRAPYALWTAGWISLLSGPLSGRITLTGARAATGYGEHVASELAGDLAAAGRVVVAGGAYGIEGSAHRAALASGGSTIAVLASGLDRPYPAGHASLLDRIIAHGLLVSEQHPGTAPTRRRFLDRGRIVAALSAASVIVEAGARSGSLHVAEEALRLGRTVGAVPGPITSAASVGPHLLLQDRRAHLVTDATDVIRLLDGELDPRISNRLTQEALDRSSIRSPEPNTHRL